jgi:5'-phosphate synthase pdxT subunit
MKIGILALQGCVEPHEKHIRALGAEAVQIRTRQGLEDPQVAGLILPGGESSTMLKLLGILDMKQSLRDFAARKPVWGVCAGSILMAQRVENPSQESFGFLDLDVRRNAFGRQLDSFTVPLAGMKEAAFIRAPRFTRVGEALKVLASYKDEPVWVESAMHMASSFHPELAHEVPSPCHQKFYEKILETQKS